jgi:hypothetical protein
MSSEEELKTYDIPKRRLNLDGAAVEINTVVN